MLKKPVLLQHFREDQFFLTDVDGNNAISIIDIIQIVNIILATND